MQVARGGARRGAAPPLEAQRLRHAAAIVTIILASDTLRLLRGPRHGPGPGRRSVITPALTEAGGIPAMSQAGKAAGNGCNERDDNPDAVKQGELQESPTLF